MNVVLFLILALLPQLFIITVAYLIEDFIGFFVTIFKNKTSLLQENIIIYF